MFRDNLKEQIEYKGLIIKELAAKTGISKRTIDTYVDSRGVIPNAVIAVKLAEALDTTVEFLVNGKFSKKASVLQSQEKDVSAYEKYRGILEALDKIPGQYLPLVEAMIHAAAEKVPSINSTYSVL
ncbi:MAG: helix-turn-helix domain-containing protein [Treponema sp.]|nr:helix-turn-helix domain-containing protein [Treponema sp.]